MELMKVALPAKGPPPHVPRHGSVNQVAVDSVPAADNRVTAAERFVRKTKPRLKVAFRKIEQGVRGVTCLGGYFNRNVGWEVRIDPGDGVIGNDQGASFRIEAVNRSELVVERTSQLPAQSVI